MERRRATLARQKIPPFHVIMARMSASPPPRFEERKKVMRILFSFLSSSSLRAAPVTQYITFWVALNASPFCLPFGYTYARRERNSTFVSSSSSGRLLVPRSDVRAAAAGERVSSSPRFPSQKNGQRGRGIQIDAS